MAPSHICNVGSTVALRSGLQPTTRRHANSTSSYAPSKLRPYRLRTATPPVQTPLLKSSVDALNAAGQFSTQDVMIKYVDSPQTPGQALRRDLFRAFPLKRKAFLTSRNPELARQRHTATPPVLTTLLTSRVDASNAAGQFSTHNTNSK